MGQENRECAKLIIYNIYVLTLKVKQHQKGLFCVKSHCVQLAHAFIQGV
uniref:Uncharacterized protein n=1 Tax=Anguilla anguilla TaxID=7936 RepID=A0A0E9UEY6_ANGAN